MPALAANGLLLAGWSLFLAIIGLSLLTERLGPRPAQTSGLLLDLVGVGGTLALYIGMWLGPSGGLSAPGAWFTPGLAALGALPFVMGWALFGWARWTLGRWWSADVQIKQGQPILRHGPYAHIRHPIYTGIGLAAIGSLLLTGQPTWLPALAAIFLYNGFKAWLEELALAAHFGPAWAEYRRAAGAFWPHLRKPQK